jgi:S1-C subfamily serine protease
MVRALGDAWRTPFGGSVDRFIDVDGTLPWGFPGGPLVDTSGAILGINSRRLVRGGTTLPTATVRHAVEQIREHGGVRRGYLGLNVHAVSLPAVLAKLSGQTSGLLLTSVEDEGPAAKAGLMLGDVLLSIGGEVLASLEAILGALSQRGGQTVELRYARAGEVRETSVVVGERPARRCR